MVVTLKKTNIQSKTMNATHDSLQACLTEGCLTEGVSYRGLSYRGLSYRGHWFFNMKCPIVSSLQGKRL